MSLIAVDVDSTLYDFSVPARNAFLHLAQRRDDKSLFRGLYQPWIEWRSTHDACGEETWAEVCEIALDPDVFIRQPPYAGAAITLQALTAAGHNIMYISSRQSKLEEVTRSWLDMHDFPKGKVLLVQTDKTPFIRQARYLIDDRPRWLIEFVYSAEWGNLRRAFGLWHPYNANLTDIPNVYLAPTWMGLNHFFVEHELLREPAYDAHSESEKA